jgi:hypothetical protein
MVIGAEERCVGQRGSGLDKPSIEGDVYQKYVINLSDLFVSMNKMC